MENRGRVLGWSQFIAQAQTSVRGTWCAPHELPACASWEKDATQTGGTYGNFHQLGETVAMRLAGLISGYYVLMLDTSQMANPGEPVRVELRQKKGRVLTKAY